MRKVFHRDCHIANSLSSVRGIISSQFIEALNFSNYLTNCPFVCPHRLTVSIVFFSSNLHVFCVPDASLATVVTPPNMFIPNAAAAAPQRAAHAIDRHHGAIITILHAVAACPRVWPIRTCTINRSRTVCRMAAVLHR